jgi:hypothetical protein
MDAPVCRTCGKKHWSRLCQGDDVTLPEPRSVTPKPVSSVTMPTAVAVTLKAECARLTAEVIILKRKLAEAGVKQTACPECERRRAATAERVRKSRAKLKG